MKASQLVRIAASLLAGVGWLSGGDNFVSQAAEPAKTPSKESPMDRRGGKGRPHQALLWPSRSTGRAGLGFILWRHFIQ